MGKIRDKNLLNVGQADLKDIIEDNPEITEAAEATEVVEEGIAMSSNSENNINSKISVTDGTIDIDKAIEELVKLSSLEYDNIRRDEARRLGMNVSTLDRLVKDAIKNSSNEDDSPFAETVPWDEPIDPEELLSGITKTILRFIVCEPETAQAATLWATMTWFMDVVNTAPIAVITAPEKRCGKSILLSILWEISYKPLSSSNLTAATLFRSIEKWHPTLLIDEADTFLKDNEQLRGLLNAGHSRKFAFTIRCIGDDHEPKRFDLWGAKAFAGIGKLADTLMDRAITLELRRKLPNEHITRLKYAPSGTFETLRRKLARFAEDYRDVIKNAKPDLPEALNDRAQDNWEPLLAIADTAGSDYGSSARETAIKLSGNNEDVQSLGVILLSDIYEVFEAKKVDRLFTDELIKFLCEDKEKRWATYNFSGNLGDFFKAKITPKQLGKILSPYSIKSVNIRGINPTKTWAGKPSDVKKGYSLSQFKDAFQRYLSPSPMPSETSATPATISEIVSKTNTDAAFNVADTNATKDM